MKATKQVKIEGTTFENSFGRLVSSDGTYYVVSLQDKETLYRFTRCFSKKTLKAVGYNHLTLDLDYFKPSKPAGRAAELIKEFLK